MHLARRFSFFSYQFRLIRTKINYPRSNSKFLLNQMQRGLTVFAFISDFMQPSAPANCYTINHITNSKKENR